MVQEDQIHFTMNRILEFVMNNAKLLASILGAFVVLIMAIYLLLDYRSDNQQELQAVLGQAIDKFQTQIGETQDPGTASLGKRYTSETEKYNDALSAFTVACAKTKGTALFPIARYHEGLCLLELDKKSEFQSIMEQLIQSGENAEISSLATFALAESYLSQGDIGKATEFYEKLLQDPKTALPKEEILVNLAEYHGSHQDKEKAIAFWKRLLKEYPNSKSKAKAETELTKFGEKPS